MLYVPAKRTRKSYSVKYEDIYVKFSRRNDPRNGEGVKQFFEFESWGKVPDRPDPYYLRLSDGRTWMDWLRNELKDSYNRYLDGDPESGWWGWFQLREDWKNELHILKMLMNWCKTVPDWVYENELKAGPQ